ncbi:cytochrome P450 [Paenarthrobacter nitroguajacolicus]|uniref:cytochrome P450 n=1 Tax=Paenarthrobacter nitroguajacolicus TaxID=211146 RepID=UPI003AEC3974
MSNRASLPKASVLDTAAFLADVFLPTVAKGPIKRRPRMEAASERLGLDGRAVSRMRSLQLKYPDGPVLLRLPFRSQAVALRPSEVHRILENSPEPFSPASSEKRGALAHFEPRNVLISTGTERSIRRALQEQALDTDSPVHHLADHFLPVIREEMDQLLSGLPSDQQLDWERFSAAWERVVRRVVFGNSAADDVELTRKLTRLRKDANWSAIKVTRTKTRAAFLTTVRKRMLAADPGSLAHALKDHDPSPAAAPVDQIPQWLFALDPAGMATFRTLALLASHKNQLGKAQQELAEDTSGHKHLPYLRACVLESLRLWPTTPMILRQTTREVQWGGGIMPAKCGVLVFAPYFHRDSQLLPHADLFHPELWLDQGTVEGDRPGQGKDWALVPFSEGPVRCPGRQLVLLLTSATLARFIEETDFRLSDPGRLGPDIGLPSNLNPFSLRFTVLKRDATA